ncbi:hypothetical protein S83_055655, partial [Arachis hypogaea]
RMWEAVWQIRLGATEEFYPQRPGEADCIYYLRTRFCGYGSHCRFNHLRDRVEIRFHCVRPMDRYSRLSEGSQSDPASVVAVGAVARAGGWEYLEPIGQPFCIFLPRVFLSLSFDEDLGMSEKKDEREEVTIDSWIDM